jgi:hypothetical protein
MRVVLLLLVFAAAAAAQCPLGFTPPEACYEGAPKCALYTDADGDQRCDNPGPQPVIDPEPETEPEPVEETEPEVETEPEQEEPQVLSEPETTPPETISPEVTEEVEPTADSLVVVVEETEPDSVALDPGPPVVQGCPLGYTEEQACSVEAPGCTLFTDADGDGRCDNPLPDEEPDTTHAAPFPVIGCPLGLPPEAACPGDLALCPHWFGQSESVPCSNPSAGDRRVFISLIALSALMILSTVLSRRLKGRKLHERLRRNLAHRTVHGLSLIILGFGIQGCFCPLGVFQYAFLKDGLVFLGWMGVAILVIPFLFASFFGRIFCCWVCPMGAMQELVFRIPSPGKLNPRGRVSRTIGRFRFVVLGALVTVLLLNRFGAIQIPWPAIFCRLDPFHTIFTLFLAGSMVTAGVTLLFSVFIRRFFCRYLCFLGAALSLFSPLRLYSRIRGKKPEKTVCEF